MATHSSVLAWRIPGTGDPGGLPPMGPHRVGHDWSDLAAAAAVYFSFQLQYSLALFGSSLYIFNSLLNFSLCSSIFHLSSLSSFITITLNSLLGRLFIATLFNCALSFGTYSFNSLFCSVICVYFYVLGTSVLFTDLKKLALYRRCPMENSRVLSSGHQYYML